MKHIGTALVIASTLLAVVSASRVDAHGGDPDLVHSCVKNNGTIRIIAPNGSCRVHETPLDWGLEGPQGPTGDPGADGANGANGADGANGVSGYQVVVTQVEAVVAGQTVTFIAVCPNGKAALGGGMRSIDLGSGKLVINGSFPGASAAWSTQVTNQDSFTHSAQFYAICAFVN